jgi:hypothetical protein
MTIVETLFIAMWVSNGSQLAMGIAYIKILKITVHLK